MTSPLLLGFQASLLVILIVGLTVEIIHLHRQGRYAAFGSPTGHRCPYRITLAEVADLSQGFDPTVWDKAWKDRDCAWRQIARIDKKVPPSWMLADRVITAGLRGTLFPSLRHACGTNW
jgi:hypothetical protein